MPGVLARTLASPGPFHSELKSLSTKKRKSLGEDVNKNAVFFGEEEVEDDIQTESSPVSITSNSKIEAPSSEYRLEIVWRNVIIMASLHGLTLYAIFTALPTISPGTFYFTFFLAFLTSVGVQAGAHRLWAHRAYKANAAVRLFLSLCHVLSLQNDLYEWCRDHRAHHKWSDTDADPHNSTRGFFFSHVGWLLVKKHPEVLRRGRTLDLSDLEADPIVMWTRRFYLPMVFIFWGLLPTYLPVYLWGEPSLWNSFLVCVVLRYVYTLNVTWCVNSWSHLYGYRPYDGKIAPVEASIRHVLNGEGFHNYHHAFPWDYSASELGPWDVFNPVTAVIDFFHYMGWAWDLKKVSPKLVKATMDSKGDHGQESVHYHQYYYKEGSSLREWIGGLATYFGPLLFLRYTIMAVASIL